MKLETHEGRFESHGIAFDTYLLAGRSGGGFLSRTGNWLGGGSLYGVRIPALGLESAGGGWLSERRVYGDAAGAAFPRNITGGSDCAVMMT